MKVKLSAFIISISFFFGIALPRAHAAQRKIAKSTEVTPFSFNEPALQSLIFNASLSKEFKRRYQEKFGTVDSAALSYKQKNSELLNENIQPGQKAVQDNSERKEFAFYMMKRLTEYHLDHFLKTDPSAKVIYEAKEKFSHAEIQFDSNIKIETKYTFGANILDVILHNPFCESRLAIEMDAHSFLPTAPEEHKVILGKQLSTSVKLNSQTAFRDGITSVELAKTLNPHWNLATKAQTYFKQGITTRENRLSLSTGFSF